MRSNKVISALVGAALLLTLAAGCSPNRQQAEPKGKSYFTYFDTVSYVYSYAGDSAERFDSRSAESPA